MKSELTVGSEAEIEHHPLEPFTPTDARALLLGSFPPPRTRWSIEFYYPNFQNDMWRVWGLLYYGDKDHFCLNELRRYDLERIIEFCRAAGLAIYDTASSVRRLRGDAADKFLEIAVPTDIGALLDRMPECRAIVATGGLSAQTIAERYGSKVPDTGTKTEISIDGRAIDFWRMPSTSRAYPMAVERKAALYERLMNEVLRR